MTERTETLERIAAKARHLRDLERSLGTPAASGDVFAQMQQTKLELSKLLNDLERQER